jgi:thymidylate synthase (FAD)
MDAELFKVDSHHGDDLLVVNAARVSMGKRKEALDEQDIGLINYLARNGHWSPFRHCVMTARVKVPIFVMRQWQKHRIGMEINEISGRYVEFQEEEYWSPEYPGWRKATPSVKQGSSDETFGMPDDDYIQDIYLTSVIASFRAYQALLNHGVCREQARAVLPLATFTQCMITASLQAWFHFWKLRSDSHAQKEIQLYAGFVNDAMSELYPHSWAALKEYSH